MNYEAGLWHRFLSKTKSRPRIFDITVQGSDVYWRLGLEGTKCATRRIEHSSVDKAQQTMTRMIDEKLADGFKHQRSMM